MPKTVGTLAEDALQLKDKMLMRNQAADERAGRSLVRVGDVQEDAAVGGHDSVKSEE